MQEWDTKSEPEYLRIQTDIAEKYRLQAEAARIRKARYDDKRPDKHHGKGIGSHHEEPAFIAWDGEGPRDTGYSLFGNSNSDRIRHPRLATKECLDLILHAERVWPDAIHIAFGFNYDVSNILTDLSWRHFAALHEYTRTVWRDYEIEHIPHKWFKVKKGNTTAKIYDIRSFFAGDYVSCLDEFGIGTSSERDSIRAEKKRRSEFLYSEIDAIEEYWRLELRLMPLLAEKLRDVFRDAGYVPRSWHGPGALARMALSRHKVYDAMAECPIKVRLAAQSAFAGGRFELFQAGHVNGKVYVADINSAYPYYATKLPNLARGKWRTVRTFEPGKFAVYHIKYQAKPDPFRPYPLFRRLSNGSVVWPYKVDGWYWSPEAELVANDPDARILKGYVFDEDDPSDRPFSWLSEYYTRRKRLQANGNAAQYTFKLLINAVYGQLAQRAGWNRHRRTAPRSHQLEWAGYITSACRAAVYRLAVEAGPQLLSIDTDGVSALSPFEVDSSSALGGWELDEYDDGIFWQSGIYTLKQGSEWRKAKTRGIPKGSYTANDLLVALYNNEPLRLSKKVFVTYGLAGQGQRKALNTWRVEPHTFSMGGDGKRIHVARSCKFTCGSMHKLSLLHLLYGPDDDAQSKRHWLPWLDTEDIELANAKMIMDDRTLFALNDLDFDDEWVRDYEYEDDMSRQSAI